MAVSARPGRGFTGEHRCAALGRRGDALAEVGGRLESGLFFELAGGGRGDSLGESGAHGGTDACQRQGSPGGDALSEPDRSRAYLAVGGQFVE